MIAVKATRSLQVRSATGQCPHSLVRRPAMQLPAPRGGGGGAHTPPPPPRGGSWPASGFARPCRTWDYKDPVQPPKPDPIGKPAPPFVRNHDPAHFFAARQAD